METELMDADPAGAALAPGAPTNGIADMMSDTRRPALPIPALPIEDLRVDFMT
jgi:hypothetical protein